LAGKLYRGDQFYWWSKPKVPEKTTDLSQVTDKPDRDLSALQMAKKDIKFMNINSTFNIISVTSWQSEKFEYTLTRV
jgi:CTP:phosphocholine cytidylyltransferase-like protein